MKARYLPHEEAVDLLGRLQNVRRIQYKSGTDAYLGTDAGIEVVAVSSPMDGSAIVFSCACPAGIPGSTLSTPAPVPAFDALHLVERAVCEQTISEMTVEYGVDLGNGATLVYGTRYAQPTWCVLMPVCALSIVWWSDR